MICRDDMSRCAGGMDYVPKYGGWWHWLVPYVQPSASSDDITAPPASDDGAWRLQSHELIVPLAGDAKLLW